MSSLTTGTRVGEFSAAVSMPTDSIRVEMSDVDGFAVDGMTPDVLVEPATMRDLQSILTEASAAGVSVVPVGGGTHLAAGNIPAAYDVALSLRRLDRVVEYEPADLVVTVEAGVRLADLQVCWPRGASFSHSIRLAIRPRRSAV